MVAECGGFMYLHSLLYPKMEAGSVAEGCAMAGVLDAECRYAGKLVRFGYIELEEVRGNFLPPYEKIKAKMPALRETEQEFEDVEMYKYPGSVGRIGFLK